MNVLVRPNLPEAAQPEIVYPESDGEPMADNSKQFWWIIVLAGNLAALFRDNKDVFVGGNQNWFPREREPELVKAPDVYVVFGRPKGHRASWNQWEEGDVPLTVVFEVLSPRNTWMEMDDKQAFYEEHGAEEYYVYDPAANRLKAFVRQGDAFRRVRLIQGFVSPRLGIRFDLSGPEMTVFYPDGRRFLTFEELEEARVQEKQRADRAEQRADQAEQEANQVAQRAARLAELSRKARRGLASEEELQELDRLEDQAAPPGTP
jgi:Uma2 family endonuclease